MMIKPLSSTFTKWLKTYFVPLMLFFILSSFVTWPLIKVFSTAIIGGGGDARHLLWVLWHTKEALFPPENFFYTYFLYFPYGTTLLTSALGPLMGIFSLPFWYWGPEAAYNGTVLIGFALSGYAMYLLAYNLKFTKTTSFFAGVYYLMAPIHLTAVWGHLNKVFLGLLPLLLLFFHNAVAPTKRIWWAVGTGVILLLALLHSAEQFVFGGLALLFFGVVALISSTPDQRGIIFKRLFVAASSALLLSAPVLLKIYQVTKSPLLELDKSLESYHNQPDLIQFFMPTTFSKFTQIPFFNSIYQYNHSRIETAVFLTWTGIILMIVAVIIHNPKMWRWLAFTGCCILFALGPDLLLLGNHTFTKYQIPIMMPYAILTNFSVFEFLRTPGRFMLIGFVGMGIVAAYGLEYISGKLRISWQHNSLIIVVIGLILFENWPPPYSYETLPPTPEFYKRIAHDTDSYGVFDLPVRPFEKQTYTSAYTVFSSYYQIFQMAHKKGIASGYIDRKYKIDPLFGHFVSDIIRELPEQSRIQVNGHPSNRYANMTYLLAKLGYRYVVFHKPNSGFDQYGYTDGSWGEQQAHQFIDTVFKNTPPFFNDNLTTVYKVPTMIDSSALLEPSMALRGFDNWPLSPATFFVSSPYFTTAKFEIIVDAIQVPNTDNYFHYGYLTLESAKGFTASTTISPTYVAQLPVVLEPGTQVITLTIQSDENADAERENKDITINIRRANLQISEKIFAPPDLFVNGAIQQQTKSGLRVLYGTGWYKEDAPTWRWANSPAELFIFSPIEQQLSLTMAVGFLNDLRKSGNTAKDGIMSVYLNDEILQKNEIYLAQPYIANMKLRHGWNRVKFELTGGNFQPALVNPASGDLRELSFAVTQLDINTNP